MPELQAPFDAVVPSENFAASVPVSSMGLEATAFVSPVIVTTEQPGVCSKFESVTIVTVIVFSCPARGLLWPMFFVVQLAAWTFEQQQQNKKTTCQRKELFIFGRLDWNADRKKDTSRIANDTIVNEFRELNVPKACPTVSSIGQGRKTRALALLEAGSWGGQMGV